VDNPLQTVVHMFNKLAANTLPSALVDRAPCSIRKQDINIFSPLAL